MPSASTAQACFQPTLTAVAVVMPATATGLDLSDVVPSPSSPYPLYPQQRTVPSTRAAHELQPPVSTEIAGASPLARPQSVTVRAPLSEESASCAEASLIAAAFVAPAPARMELEQ